MPRTRLKAVQGSRVLGEGKIAGAQTRIVKRLIITASIVADVKRREADTAVNNAYP